MPFEPVESIESIPVPHHVLEEMKFALSGMQCRPSNLPEKLQTVEICGGEYRIYFDGNLCILVELPKQGQVVKEGSIHGFFYTHSFSMFAGTFCGGSDKMPVLIGDDFYYMPCGEALFHMMKAALFKDWDSFKKIYYSATPKECKAAGNKVQNFVDAEWLEKSAGYMEEIARLKLQCKDVYQTFCRLAEIADTHGIPNANVYFYESTCKDKRYGTGLDINEMVQCVLERDDVKTIQQAVEPINPVLPKLGGLCYPGDNVLGVAITKSYKLFVQLEGPKRTIDQMMIAYKELTGRSFYKTILTVDDTNAKKKLKLDDAVPMAVDEGLATFSGDKGPLVRTPTEPSNRPRASTPIDVRDFSDVRDDSDVRTLSEGCSDAFSIARCGSMD